MTWAIDPTLTPSLLPKDTGEPGAGGEPADSKSTAVSARQAMEDRIRSGQGSTPRGCCPTPTPTWPRSPTAGSARRPASTLVRRAAAGGRAARRPGATSRGRPTAATPRTRDGRCAGSFRAPASRPRWPRRSRACPLGHDTGPAQRSSTAACRCSPTTTAEHPAGSRRPPRVGGASLSTQQFVADSVGPAQRTPGHRGGRSVFVAAPRSVQPRPGRRLGLLRRDRSIPWLDPATTRPTAERPTPPGRGGRHQPTKPRCPAPPDPSPRARRCSPPAA